jgi:hypothetical protein
MDALSDNHEQKEKNNVACSSVVQSLTGKTSENDGEESQTRKKLPFLVFYEKIYILVA